VRGLTQVASNPPRPDLADEAALLARASQFVGRMLKQCEAFRPPGEIIATSGEHYAYFALQGAVARVRQWLRRFEDRLAEERELARRYAQQPAQFRHVRHKKQLHNVHVGGLLQALAAAEDIQRYLQDLAERALQSPRFGSGADDDGELSGNILDLVHYTAYVQALADCVVHDSPQQVLLHLRAANPADVVWLKYLATKVLPQLLDASLGLEVTPLERTSAIGQEHTLLVKGLAALPLARLEEGTHLFCPDHGGLVPLQILVWPVPAAADALSVLQTHLEERARWQQRLASGEANLEDDPYQLRPVVGVYQENGRRVDLRSGAVYPNVNKEWLLAALPLPPEFVN
jgi:hypothetical protein